MAHDDAASAGGGQLEDERPQQSAAELTVILRGGGGCRASVDLLVCPPATLVAAFAGAGARLAGARSAAQDCHAEPSGAFTGDISAEMLADAGASA